MSAPVPDGPRTTVLGVGNPLLEDDGVGLVLLAALQARAGDPGPVRYLDGGTWGLSLLPDITETDRLLVLDAVRTGSEPGTVVVGRDDDIPRLYSRPPSPHQIDLREVLGAAELLGALPATITVVGVEPLRTEGLHVGLSDPVAAAVPLATETAADILRSWGA